MASKRIGVIGAGHLGRIHIKCLMEEGHSDFLAFHEPNFKQAQKIQTEFGIRHYEVLDELIDNSDCLIIVSPTPTHFDIARKGLLAGKDLFIEKPVTSSAAEAQELLQINEKAKQIVQIGHVERFNPAFMEYEKFDLSPKFIESHRLSTYNPRGTDVSVVMDLMIHDLDLLLYVVQSEVVEVRAVGVPLVSDHADICNARLVFKNGSVANVTASRISMKTMRKMRFFQKDAYATVNFIKKSFELYRMSDQDLPKNEGHSFEFDAGNKKLHINAYIPDVQEFNAIKEEHKSFLHSAETKTKPIVSLADGAGAVLLAERIMDQMEIESKDF